MFSHKLMLIPLYIAWRSDMLSQTRFQPYWYTITWVLRFIWNWNEKNVDISSYSFCVTLKEIILEDFNNIIVFAIICIKNRGNIQKVYNAYTIEMIEVGSTDCGKIVKENVDHIIDDCFHLEVEKWQIYKDKTTTVKVVKNYSIWNQFRFRVKRSSSTKWCNLFVYFCNLFIYFCVLIICIFIRYGSSLDWQKL